MITTRNFRMASRTSLKRETKHSSLAVASSVAAFAGALLLATVAHAQAASGGMQQTMPTQSMPVPNGSAQPGQANDPSAGMTTNNGASMADQAFVSEIFESDKAQVELGQLAQQKSLSPDVKQLGQKMADNRAKLDQQLKPIADKLNVKMPREPDKKERQEIARLQTLSGSDFDQEYIKVVAKGNEKDIKNFETEEQSASDPNLLQAAKQDAPVLSGNQKAVEQIAQAHSVELSQK